MHATRHQLAGAARTEAGPVGHSAAVRRRSSLRLASALAGLGLAAAARPAIAAPVPESERIPVDLRRTTFVVRDIDKSLLQCRDALGFKVIYDERTGPGPDQDRRQQPTTGRLVLMRANDDCIGVLRLMQQLNVAPSSPPPVFQKAQPGDTILVINVANLDTRVAKVRATPHVKIADEPERVEYPAPAAPAPRQP